MLARERGMRRETMRRRFHTSADVWLRHHPLLLIPHKNDLIAIVDGLWFTLGKRQYTVMVILLRSVAEEVAIPAVMWLGTGGESRANWHTAFSKLPRTTQQRIVAVVADGATPLLGYARSRGWQFQWCHAHMKRKIMELRGLRALPGQQIRKQVVRHTFQFLDTPDERVASLHQHALKNLFQDSQCPPSIRKRLSGLIRRSDLLRTFARVPEYNLPTTTNSVEQVNFQLREVFSRIRGTRTRTSLRWWLRLLHHAMQPIACRGFRQTIRPDI